MPGKLNNPAIEKARELTGRFNMTPLGNHLRHYKAYLCEPVNGQPKGVAAKKGIVYFALRERSNRHSPIYKDIAYLAVYDDYWIIINAVPVHELTPEWQQVLPLYLKLVRTYAD